MYTSGAIYFFFYIFRLRNRLRFCISRYFAICHPLTTKMWSLNRINLMVAVAWGVSLLFSLPQVSIFSYSEIKEGSGVYDCWAAFNPPWTLPLYITWFTCAVYVVPVMFLSIVYGKICYVVWQSLKTCDPQRKTMDTHTSTRTGKWLILSYT